MAKKKEEGIAEKMFVELMKSQKEIAITLEVTEKTVSEWVRKGNWKAIRDARLNNSESRSENIKKVISELTDTSLEVLGKIKEAEYAGDKKEVLALKKESTRIAQEVGMYQKALEKMDKQNKISLSVYLEIMEDIFQGLQSFDNDVFLQTIDFQKIHLQHVAQKHA